LAVADLQTTAGYL